MIGDDETEAKKLSKINKKVIITGNGIYKFEAIIKNSKIDYITPLIHQNIDLASIMISIFLQNPEIPEFNFEFISQLEPYYLRKSQAEINFYKRKKKNGK